PARRKTAEESALAAGSRGPLASGGKLESIARTGRANGSFGGQQAGLRQVIVGLEVAENKRTPAGANQGIKAVIRHLQAAVELRRAVGDLLGNPAVGGE